MDKKKRKQPTKRKQTDKKKKKKNGKKEKNRLTVEIDHRWIIFASLYPIYR